MRTGRQLIVIVVLILLVAQGAVGQGRPQTRRAVPLSPLQSEPMLAETAAGLMLGFGTSIMMARVGSTLLGPHGGEDPGLMGGVVGFAVGLALGSSLGVHLAARGYGFPARYEEAAGGALAGVLLLPALPLDIDHPATIIALFAVPTVTAALASSLGSSARWTAPAVRPVGDGVGVGVALAF